MAVKKVKNKKIILIILCIIASVIVITSIIKVSISHKEKLYNSTVSKIIETAKRCYNEEKCSSNKITLKELYDLKYLDQMSNPKTKEIFNEKSYVVIENNEGTFIVEE